MTICHFTKCLRCFIIAFVLCSKGRSFGEGRNSRVVYDSFRRYTKSDDPRRIRKHKCNKYMHYSTSEEGKYPKKRKYQDYVQSGEIAEVTGVAVDGVKGVWPLHILPYAYLIHWTYDLMHTLNNVVNDSNNSLRPTNSGNNSKKGHLYKHTNRTYTSSVVNGCKKDGIHNHLWDGSLPPWVLTKTQCKDIDQLCKQVLGWYSSEEVPQHVMRSGHALKSHDTIHWATVFGRWCFTGLGPYTDNIIELYDIMSILNSNRLHGPTVKKKLFPRLIDVLITRSGLMPPSECCVTLHEMVHLCEQILEIGPGRQSTLYKFEKMNKILKSLGKNTAKGNLDLYATTK